MEAKPRAARSIQSVVRALAMIELLGEHPEGLALSVIARRVGVVPQTAQSLLRTLQRSGWATQGRAGGPYQLGPACHRVSRRWVSGFDLASCARERVAALSEETGEYVLLAALKGREVARLVEAQPHRPLMVHPSSDTRAPHTMATGKVLLAYLEPAEQAAMLKGVRLERRGPRSPGTRAELRRQLLAIRADGFAECVEEAGEGVVALAVPVRDADGRVAAALGTALPLLRYAGSRPAELRAALCRAAEDIAVLLGREGTCPSPAPR